MTLGSVFASDERRSRWPEYLLSWGLPILVLAFVASMYWPVWQAKFVWDDKLCLHDAGWLRYGDDWKHFLIRDYCQWQNYFRPLVVGLFTLEVRLFDSVPGPMHLVSLGIHLVNTALVGFVALTLTGNGERTAKAKWLTAISMLLYGIHPALIEPVVWIGCQAELMVTLLTLLAILLNKTIRHPLARALAVGVCFLLAAGFKESAMALPPLLVLVDLIEAPENSDSGWLARIRRLWSRQWPVYGAMVLAGIVYLAIRRWALGELVHSLTGQPLFSVTHLQEVCAIYVTYLRILVWPMVGLGPVHFNTSNFAAVTAQSVFIDTLALAIFGVGLWGFWKRYALGAFVMCATVALLPVLHIAPVAFDGSLYHERYLMMGLAVICSLLPPTFSGQHFRHFPATLKVVAPLALAGWIGFATANVRATLPLWADNQTLWEWALREDPHSIDVKDHLLTAYMDRNDHERARALSDSIMAGGVRCPSCWLNAAHIAVAEKDIPRLSAAIERLKSDGAFVYDSSLMRDYVFAVGQLLELQGDLPGAETAYREATEMDPLEPVAQVALAMLLAQKGKLPEARTVLGKGLALSAPDDREWRRKMFEASLLRAPGAKAREN